MVSWALVCSYGCDTWAMAMAGVDTGTIVHDGIEDT